MQTDGKPSLLHMEVSKQHSLSASRLDAHRSCLFGGSAALLMPTLWQIRLSLGLGLRGLPMARRFSYPHIGRAVTLLVQIAQMFESRQ